MEVLFYWMQNTCNFLNPLQKFPKYHSDSDTYGDGFVHDQDKKFLTLYMKDINLLKQIDNSGYTQDILEGIND